jgi:hypothetical protein
MGVIQRKMLRTIRVAGNEVCAVEPSSERNRRLEFAGLQNTARDEVGVLRSVAPILDQLLAQRDTPLWAGYVNMLKTLQGVFLSPRHWILEFLQNAEDAGAPKFAIRLDEEYLTVSNNGNAFEEPDVRSLCDVNSRKMPSLGFKGYIGIGFKSIFVVASRIELHSGEYHFCFDKSKWISESRSEAEMAKWPWEVFPLDVLPMVPRDDYSTEFRIGCRDVRQNVLGEIREFLEKEFPDEIVLLLSNVHTVEVATPTREFTLVRDDGLDCTPRGFTGRVVQSTVTKKDRASGKEETSSFLICFRPLKTPDYVRSDPETRRVKRSDIPETEIGLIFWTGSDRRIRPEHGRLAGVYSFLPIEGEQTGLPFGICGDFIPQVGRDLVNYGVEWNKWLAGEVVSLFRDTVTSVLAPDPQWGSCMLALLENLKDVESEGGRRMWGPLVRKPIEEFMENAPLFPDEDGTLRRLASLVSLSDDSAEELYKQLRELVPQVLQGKSVASRTMTGYPGRLSKSIRLETISPYDLVYSTVQDAQGLESLKTDRDALASMYRAVGGLDRYYLNGRGGRALPIASARFVLCDDGEYREPSKVMVVASEVGNVSSVLAAVYPKDRALLHRDLSRDPEIVRSLTECGVQNVNEAQLLSELESRLRDHGNRNAQWPQYPDDMIAATLFLISRRRPNSSIYLPGMVAFDGSFQGIENLYIPAAPLDWSKLANRIPGFFAIHPRYLDQSLLESWSLETHEVLSFLAQLGVHGFSAERDKSLIEKAGYYIASEKLETEGHKIAIVKDRKLLGYDLQCMGHCGQVFEVKSMSSPGDIVLENSECLRAEEKKSDYVLVIVYGLPNEVHVKEIPDPSRVWVPDDRAKVPENRWLLR